jgi:hypothetical protein
LPVVKCRAVTQAEARHEVIVVVHHRRRQWLNDRAISLCWPAGGSAACGKQLLKLGDITPQGVASVQPYRLTVGIEPDAI